MLFLFQLRSLWGRGGVILNDTAKFEWNLVEEGSEQVLNLTIHNVTVSRIT